MSYKNDKNTNIFTINHNGVRNTDVFSGDIKASY
jgi:hypothetical protein